jgi:hypothetical protein
MLRTILVYGVFAGLVVAVPMMLLMANSNFGDNDHGSHSLITGYALMLLAFTMIFIGVKRYRDRTLGGVIRFLPALLVGLGISVIASVIYVIGWEITLAATDYSFMADYSAAMLEAERARGVAPEIIAQKAAELAKMTEDYKDPFYRMPLTFVEIFPVGVIVSLVTALLMRNSRFLPMKVETTA